MFRIAGFKFVSGEAFITCMGGHCTDPASTPRLQIVSDVTSDSSDTGGLEICSIAADRSLPLLSVKSALLELLFLQLVQVTTSTLIQCYCS